jgi:uncharacterized protein YndB with AHSA1/START domain
VNGSLETIDDRPAVRIARRLDHSVARVWRAITETDELRSWAPDATEWTLEPGAEFSAEQGVGTGRIEEIDEPRLLAYEFGGDTFRYELRPDGDGCVLTFTHVFDDRALAAQDATGWEIYLDRLESHLAGEVLSEDEAHTVFTELHERYARQFGVDPAVGRRFAKEHLGQ